MSSRAGAALSLWLGFRFYRARQSNSFISFISFASTAGIALGVAVLIIVLSAMNGFERELRERFLDVVPHAELVGVNEPVHSWQAMVADASKIPGIRGAAPFIRLQGLAQRQGGFQGLSLVGIDTSLEGQVSGIESYMPTDAWQALGQDENAIVLGRSLMEKLGLNEGDALVLFVPDLSGRQNGKLGATRSHKFVVRGSYHLGGELELVTAYASMAHLARVLEMGEDVSGVRIAVDDVFKAPKLIRELGFTQSQYLYMSDWTRTQGHLYQDIQLVRTLMYLVLALVIAVACFNIVSTLVMAVRDKTSEIAILMTMGLRRSAIVLVFMVHGAISGLLGTLLGVSAGVLVALNLSGLAKAAESALGVQLLSSDVYFIDFLPSELHGQDVAVVAAMALLMSLLATLYPAYKASLTEPAPALAGR
ncbi:lipoprotein-releasing ABC transporter permease subunit LolE [Shewanella amazonensis]|uniref:Lipoprotein releasing system, transmembrane protein, LolC/E family n=1 Tax=Shewanella amazonensis (strain ATCC BAA-1098 / SB2B) TaxID=326297 RepID=A1S585_SHEAM|nr:lipoprotein-releasing ABC transporter permease subunit LolE [Shewanella amazonensis]ABL99541.1 lipoprotein releasing system, transmembrane protein, LolC/E family [Shewanella amazonensis SB2B]